MPDLEALEAELGHVFLNRELLHRALTHKSRVFESQPHYRPAQESAGEFADNEQLEFLGDSILGFLVSEHLVSELPSYPEGRLSKIKAHLVSSTHLHEVARDLALGDYLLLGRGEEISGGRAKKALLANAVEALIAALYLDGGIEPVRCFVVNRIVANFQPPQDAQDYKSALQELAQSKKLPQPRYQVVAERGPEHSKTFVVEVRVGTKSSTAEGLSKKSASQSAARLVLDQLLEKSEASS
jgi:ribonuclease III